MPPRILFFLFVVAFLTAAGFLFWQDQYAGLYTDPVVINGTAVPPVPRLDAALIKRGQDIYLENCAGCHGAGLEGAAEWKTRLPDGNFPPPPHDDSGHTWHHPDFILLQIMVDGGRSMYEGAMPAFGEQLGDEDRRAILEFLKSRWNRASREYQWWLSNTYPTPTPEP